MTEETKEPQAIKHEVNVSLEVGQKIRKLLSEGGEKAFLEQADLALENQKLKDEIAKKNEEESKRGGIGTLSASLNSGEGSVSSETKEFNSMEELIDDCRINRPEIIKEMWRKTLKGFRESPNQTLGRTYVAPIITDSEGNVLDSPIRRTLMKQTGGKK
jgi:hypothetical protein